MALELSLTKWLACVVVGAVVGADSSSWLQVMVSRPIVAGTLGGALFGSAEAGFIVGALLELLSLRHPPFGAARYPDSGPAGLVGGAAYAAAGGSGMPELSTAVLVGWTIGWIGSESVHLIRTVNGHLVGDVAFVTSSPRRLVRRHRLAIRLDTLRGGAVTAALLVPGILLTRLGVGATGHLPPWMPAVLLMGAVAGSTGAASRTLGARLRWWPLLLPGPVLAYLLLR